MGHGPGVRQEAEREAGKGVGGGGQDNQAERIGHSDHEV